ncbi:MAG: DNRLRE domain-containing protein, partial [Woeseiaceae bacterium]
MSPFFRRKQNVPIIRQDGYIFIAVVVMLAIVAAMTLLVSYDSSVKASEPARQAEAARADYLAQAALQHAIWRSNNNACAGDISIPSTSFGVDNYSASVTGGGTTSFISSQVDQDAWIRNDDVTRNNGTNADQHIRFEGGRSEHALFRFDLSKLPANAQINSATAWFYVTTGGEHPEGPITIHRVTESWTETGATWDTMGGKYDSAALGMITPQATDGVWVQINLTGQVQAW